MTYPDKDSMKVEKVDEHNQALFFNLIKTLSEESSDRNRDWFPHILKNDKTKFDQWYITVHDDEIIAFSCVMKIKGYYRLVSRLYNCVRKKGMTNPVIFEEISPAMLMLAQQLKDYGDKKTFISMEYLGRRKLLKKLAVKINTLYGGNWKLNPNFYFTCPDYKECREDSSCWQSTISQNTLDLDKITIDEYKNKFLMKRKTQYG